MIPRDWKMKPLGSVIKGLSAGVSVNSEDIPAKNRQIGVLKTSAVTKGTFQPNENKTVLSRDVDRVKVSPKANTILMSRMNTKALVGASAYIDKDYENLFFPIDFG